jgi:hypothetical protein
LPYLFLTLGLVAFLLALRLLHVVERLKELLQKVRGAVRVIRDPGLSDDEKERRVQQAALGAGGSFLGILFSVTLALATAAACLAAGTMAELFEIGEALAAAMNPIFLIGLTAVAAASLKWLR